MEQKLRKILTTYAWEYRKTSPFLLKHCTSFVNIEMQIEKNNKIEKTDLHFRQDITR